MSLTLSLTWCWEKLSQKARGPWGLCCPQFHFPGLGWWQRAVFCVHCYLSLPGSHLHLSHPFPWAVSSILLSSLLPSLSFLTHIFFLPPIFVSPSRSLLKKKKNQQNQSTERLDLQMSGQETGNKGNQSEEGAGIITVINSSSRDTAPPLRLGGVERQALQGRLRGAGCQGELRHCPLLTVG